ncbi:MAG: hypothetical protein AB7S26_13195 [Sandaracinaceae bacterium]
MPLLQRIVLGVVAVLILAGYVAYRWMRIEAYQKQRAAERDHNHQYFQALKADPRWLALEAAIRQRYPFGDPTIQGAYLVSYGALVDADGFCVRLDNPSAQRVVALIARTEPADQRYVWMDLRTQEVSDHEAQYGWTFILPPR